VGQAACCVQVGMQAVLRAPDAVAAAGAASVVLAPALEELLYRGFLLPSLTRRLPVSVAVTLPRLPQPPPSHACQNQPD